MATRRISICFRLASDKRARGKPALFSFQAPSAIPECTGDCEHVPLCSPSLAFFHRPLPFHHRSLLSFPQFSTKISTNAQIFLFSLRGKPSSRIMQVFRGKRKKRERRIIMDLLSSLHLEARYARGFFSFDVRKDSDRAYVKSMTVDVGPTRAAHGG